MDTREPRPLPGAGEMAADSGDTVTTPEEEREESGPAPGEGWGGGAPLDDRAAVTGLRRATEAAAAALRTCGAARMLLRMVRADGRRTSDWPRARMAFLLALRCGRRRT
jgi:hypothetical protein